MKFDDTGLPRHPAIEKAFATLQQFDSGDRYTTRGILIAKLIATDGIHKDPEAIATGLLVPLAQDMGLFLCARADLPGRTPEILEAVFAFGKTNMTGVAMDQPYAELDPAVRSVVLASSIRMFEVTAEELEQNFGNASAKMQEGDAETLRAMLAPVRSFTEMAARNETEELVLARKCREAMQRVEACMDNAGIRLAPAAKPNAPKP